MPIRDNGKGNSNKEEKGGNAMSEDKRKRIQMTERRRLMRIEKNTITRLRTQLEQQKGLNDSFVNTAYNQSKEMCQKVEQLERENADLYATNKAFVRLINGD